MTDPKPLAAPVSQPSKSFTPIEFSERALLEIAKDDEPFGVGGSAIDWEDDGNYAGENEYGR